jgi:hypothetical protein
MILNFSTKQHCPGSTKKKLNILMGQSAEGQWKYRQWYNDKKDKRQKGKL